ncbi:MAG TPA: ABC transporter substrate-binding protein [Dehalococcoidia bacterium]|jgi:peptide/nickel transport system substrate-binding protein|nr:ABC transporter substrate-binding protein [Dehalococcoidia bacterium]
MRSHSQTELRTSRWPVSTISVVIVLALALAACSPSVAPNASASVSAVGGTLTIAQTADPLGVWPGLTPTQSTITVVEQITEKLIEYNPNGAGYVPRLATAWNQVNPTTVRFELRKNVKFSNGEPFNADSVKFSLGVMKDQKQWASGYAKYIKDATVVDPYTVDIASTAPTSLLMPSIARMAFQFPPAYFQQSTLEGFAQKPIGTGPYVFDSWTKGVSVVMTRNDTYWNGKPAFDKVVWKIIPEASSQIAALQSGAVDVVPLLPSNFWGSIQGANVKLVTAPSDAIYVAVFNTLQPGPLQNPLVRQAMQLAVDADALIKSTLEGQALPMTDQPLTSSYVGYVPNRPTFKYDPQKAKSLLAQAGFPNGFTTKLTTSSKESKEVVQVLADQLAKVGIVLQYEILDFGTFVQKLIAPPSGIPGLYYANSITGPHAHYQYVPYQTGGVFSYYANPKYQALLDQAAVEPDEAKARDLYRQMLDVLAADPAYIPLFQGKDGYAISSRLDGFAPWHTQFLDVSAWHFK